MDTECCSAPAENLLPVLAEIGPVGQGAGDCHDSCCSEAASETGGDTAVGVIDMKLDERVDCCSSGASSQDELKCDADADADADAPDCCRGKVGPCCDASCLDRLAMRECQMSAVDDSTPQAGQSTCSGSSAGKACKQHSISVVQRYGVTLETLGCICRALIALGQETCCTSREARVLSGQLSKKSSARSLLRSSRTSRSSLDSIGGDAKGTADQRKAKKNRMPLGTRSSETVGGAPKPCASSCYSKIEPARMQVTRDHCAKSCCSNTASNSSSSSAAGASDLVGPETAKTACGQLCCAEKEPAQERTAVLNNCGKSCCGATAGVATEPCGKQMSSTGLSIPAACCGSAKGVTKMPVIDNCTPSRENAGCADSCCDEIRPASSRGSCSDLCCMADSQDSKVPVLGRKPSATHEIGDVESRGSGTEHVILSISGMTCTGCETKLNRTLATVPAVKNLKTSLVLSRADFSVDLRLATVEEVMKHLERTTEFKCERVQNEGASFDLTVPDDPAKFIGQQLPDGVVSLTLVKNNIVEVLYEPKTRGARDLVEKVWGPSVELAPMRGDPSVEAGGQHVRHVGYMTLLSAILTIPVLVMAWAPLPKREVQYSTASMALATVVQFVIAGPFYPKALKALVFSKVIEMDLLIVLSTSTAYVFSVVSFGFLMANRPLSTGQFFETSTLLVTLIMVGRWVAALARQRAVESISIRSLQSSTAIIVNEEDGIDRVIDARLLEYGDVFKVLPDTRIPTDGTVITGSSEVDESMLTGESLPVEKFPKSTVIAGSVNGSGVLHARLTRLPCENSINAIAAMVDEAKLSKPKLQDLADQVASYFVPVVVGLTIITFVVWVAVGTTIRGQSGSEAAIQALTYAITVLIVSCPCAVGLAVPMVIVIASGVAAERGVIFKSADAIETAHRASHVVFDKTGTLTRGKLSVSKEAVLDDADLPTLLGLAENSRHPVSIAVAAHLKTRDVVARLVPEPKSLTGRGIESLVDGKTIQAGNSRCLNLSDHDQVQPMLSQGFTVFCFAVGGELHAVFGLEDELRPDAAQTIASLQTRGISVHIVSGDDDGAVQTVAAKLSVDRSMVQSRSSPADKKNYVQKLLDSGSGGRKPVVIFCGDGTNDAVALAQATIGVHINEGTDVAQSAADVVLMRPSVGGILTMMRASHKSVNRIKFNFAWSLVYNTFAVLLAAGAFVNARIPPGFAGLGELVSVLPVIAAAVMLRWSNI